MNKKIIVQSSNLQIIIDNFLLYIKNNFNIDINNKKYKDKISVIASDHFSNYEIQHFKLFILAAELYAEGYNVFDKSISWNINKPFIIINETLKDYALDIIDLYQNENQ